MSGVFYLNKHDAIAQAKNWLDNSPFTESDLTIRVGRDGSGMYFFELVEPANKRCRCGVTGDGRCPVCMGLA